LTQQLVLDQKPKAFFLEQFEAPPAALSGRLSIAAKFYLADTLASFIMPQTLSDQPDIWNLRLFDLLKLAIESEESHDRLKYFKLLGDKSLYISGFFQESFNRKTFDIGYYSSMGRTAYHQGAALTSAQNKEQKQVLTELSKTFLYAIELIAHVADSSQSHSPKNLLGVYERWTKTKSKRLYNILKEAGIDPIYVDSSDYSNAS